MVEAVVARHATALWGRPARRHDEPGVGATWTIDGEVVVEFRYVPDGRDRLLVHDFSLAEALRQPLRTRHVDVEHA